MSDTEKDVIYPEELYIKEEDPEKLDIKEESVEYCAEGDEECEYKFIPLPSLKEETGDGSITGSQSAASVCKETNFGIFQEAKTKEEVEYRASCDTTVGYQHTLTEQEDLPQSEGKRTSTTKDADELVWSGDISELVDDPLTGCESAFLAHESSSSQYEDSSRTPLPSNTIPVMPKTKKRKTSKLDNNISVIMDSYSTIHTAWKDLQKSKIQKPANPTVEFVRAFMNMIPENQPEIKNRFKDRVMALAAEISRDIKL